MKQEQLNDYIEAYKNGEIIEVVKFHCKFRKGNRLILGYLYPRYRRTFPSKEWKLEGAITERAFLCRSV